jgi:hypothetical protein
MARTEAAYVLRIVQAYGLRPTVANASSAAVTGFSLTRCAIVISGNINAPSKHRRQSPTLAVMCGSQHERSHREALPRSPRSQSGTVSTNAEGSGTPPCS